MTRLSNYWIVAVALFLGAPWVFASWNASPLATGIASLVTGGLVLASIGPEGLLKDERARWSLSRFQLLLWTWLLLSTFWALVVLRITAAVADPAAVEMDQNLWLLLGINATSFVGSPLILARKRAAGLLDKPIGATGGVRDLFRGEATADADIVDIGRIQMFFFTIVAFIIYAAATAAALWTAHDLASVVFPKVSDSLLALLAISHGTYLVNKIPDRAGGAR